MLWGFAIPTQPPGSSRHIDGIGGLQIPRLNRSNLFYDGLQIRCAGYAHPPLGVPADMLSAVKK